MSENNFRQCILGAAAGFIGLGLQKYLPVTEQIPLERNALILFGFFLVFLYFCFLALGYILQKAYQRFKTHIDKLEGEVETKQ